MDYLEWEIKLSPFQPAVEIIVALLEEAPFESFQEEEPYLRCFAPIKEGEDYTYWLQNIEAWANSNHVTFSINKKRHPHTNWNEVWESQFDPIYLNGYCLVAPFHSESLIKGEPIWISPKMSFGTGHHATTYLLSEELIQYPPKGEKVLDVGTGTGILAILCEKLGAEEILGTEIESWSVDNARENAALNNCCRCSFVEGDLSNLTGLTTYDLVVANINRNVLMRHLPYYADMLNPKGRLLLSGFFETDVVDLIASAQLYGLKHSKILLQQEWAALVFEK